MALLKGRRESSVPPNTIEMSRMPTNKDQAAMDMGTCRAACVSHTERSHAAVAYERSSAVAKRLGNAVMVTNVELYHAREAILRGAPWARAVMDEAWRAYRMSRRLSGLSIDRYLSKLDLAARD